MDYGHAAGAIKGARHCCDEIWFFSAWKELCRADDFKIVFTSPTQTLVLFYLISFIYFPPFSLHKNLIHVTHLSYDCI